MQYSTCHPRFPGFPRLSTPPGTQSAKNTGDDNNSVSGSNPGSFIVMMQIPIATNRRCLHPAQHCSKSSKIIRRTLRCIPSYSKLIKQRSLTLFQGFYFSSTRGYLIGFYIANYLFIAILCVKISCVTCALKIIYLDGKRCFRETFSKLKVKSFLYNWDNTKISDAPDHYNFSFCFNIWSEIGEEPK